MTKTTELLFGGSLILTGIVMGWISGTTATTPKNDSFASEPLPVIETFNGTAEYYFKPAGDYRLWHVINKYGQSQLNDGPGYNMSSYTFSSDSVTVINEFTDVPKDGQIIHSGLTQNNLNHQ